MPKIVFNAGILSHLLLRVCAHFSTLSMSGFKIGSHTHRNSIYVRTISVSGFKLIGIVSMFVPYLLSMSGFKNGTNLDTIPMSMRTNFETRHRYRGYLCRYAPIFARQLQFLHTSATKQPQKKSVGTALNYLNDHSYQFSAPTEILSKT